MLGGLKTQVVMPVVQVEVPITMAVFPTPRIEENNGHCKCRMGLARVS